MFPLSAVSCGESGLSDVSSGLVCLRDCSGHRDASPSPPCADAAWSETGYAYTSDVYREISQVETNFGGMEYETRVGFITCTWVGTGGLAFLHTTI